MCCGPKENEEPAESLGRVRDDDIAFLCRGEGPVSGVVVFIVADSQSSSCRDSRESDPRRRFWQRESWSHDSYG